MPRLETNDRGENIHKEMVEMSDFQFGIYQKIRKEWKRDREKSNKKSAKKKSTMAQAVNEATTGEVSKNYFFSFSM